MKGMRKVVVFMLAVLLACSLFACVGDTAVKVELNKTTVQLAYGGSEKLVATVTNSTEKVTWLSDKPSVATVAADGTVKAVSAGTAIVSATVGDVVATATITVAKSPVTITVDPTAVELEIGEEQQLVAALSDETKLETWATDKSTVATVSETGMVKAIAAGTATITATIDGNVATCVVTVNAPSIIINKSTATLYMGSTLELECEVYGSTSPIVWSSSDIAKATVAAKPTSARQAIVTPVALGTTTITVTCGTLSATCVVTVKAALTITLDKTAVTINKEGASEASAIITATVVGADGDVTINWTSSNAAKATVASEGANSAKVIAVADGNTIITATVEGTPFSATAAVMIVDLNSFVKVYSAQDFLNISKALSSNYVLCNDIDFKGANIAFLGMSATGNAVLNGTIDGNGYSLKNFYIGKPGTITQSSMLESNKGTIRRLGFEGKIVYAGSNAVIARYNDGTIDNVYLDMQYEAGDAWARGYANQGAISVVNNKTISNCVIKLKTNSIVAKSYDIYAASAGAVFGWNDAKATAENCFVFDPKINNGVAVGGTADVRIFRSGLSGVPAKNPDGTDSYGKEDTVRDDGHKLPANSKHIETKELRTTYSVLNTAIWDIPEADADGKCGIPTLKNGGAVAPANIVINANDGAFTDNKLTLSATIVGTTSAVVWSSSDIAVATIDAATGDITPLTAGSTTISATITGTNPAAPGEVLVATQVVKVGAVWEANELNKEIKVGEQLDLSTHADMTWTVNNANIIACDGGVCMATGVGEGVVIAKAASGAISKLNVTVIPDDIFANEEFENGLPTGWVKNINGGIGDVTVADGKMILTQNKMATETNIKTNIVVPAGVTNYAIEVKMTISDNGTDKERYAGIRFKASSTTPDYAQMCVRKCAGETGKVEFAQNINSAWKVEKNKNSENIDGSKYYTFRVEVRGNEVKEYINDVFIVGGTLNAASNYDKNDITIFIKTAYGNNKIEGFVDYLKVFKLA